MLFPEVVTSFPVENKRNPFKSIPESEICALAPIAIKQPRAPK